MQPSVTQPLLAKKALPNRVAGAAVAAVHAAVVARAPTPMLRITQRQPTVSTAVMILRLAMTLTLATTLRQQSLQTTQLQPNQLKRPSWQQ